MMHMMDYNQMGMMSGGGMLGMLLLWLIWFSLGSFVFSWIFWKTHNAIAKKR